MLRVKPRSFPVTGRANSADKRTCSVLVLRPMTPDPAHLLTDLLKQVSRSFYLTLRVLPRAVRPQIGLAYLLARATDTIADTELIPVSERLAALHMLRDRITGIHPKPLDFGELSKRQGEPAEAILLRRIEEAVSLLQTLSEADRRLIHQVLTIITSGQELDLQRFGLTGTAHRTIPLTDPPELDDYTYRVAGCVGEFWTKICRAHLFPRARLDDAALLRNGVRFGKGLQLVNILRDLPKDLGQGRCYLPADELAKIGLHAGDLLDPRNEPVLRPLYNRHLDMAHDHLAAGWEYTNTLPWTCVRVRLACAWPVLIGIRTLAKLRTGNVLDASQRIKVTRVEVRGLMLRSIVWYPFPTAWKNLFKTEASRAS